jgi:hypothetical protein
MRKIMDVIVKIAAFIALSYGIILPKTQGANKNIAS